MGALSKLRNRDLVWVAQEGSWDSALRAGGEEVGFLRFERGTIERATGGIEGRTWTLEHKDSVTHPRILVLAEGSTDPAAMFDYGVNGVGVVSFPDGVRYHFRPSFPGSRTWCFRREGEKARVCVAEDPPNRRGSKVRVCGDAASQPETPILLLVGWFLQVQIYERFMTSLVVW